MKYQVTEGELKRKLELARQQSEYWCDTEYRELIRDLKQSSHGPTGERQFIMDHYVGTSQVDGFLELSRWHQIEAWPGFNSFKKALHSLVFRDEDAVETPVTLDGYAWIYRWLGEAGVRILLDHDPHEFASSHDYDVGGARCSVLALLWDTPYLHPFLGADRGRKLAKETKSPVIRLSGSVCGCITVDFYRDGKVDSARHNIDKGVEYNEFTGKTFFYAVQIVYE